MQKWVNGDRERQSWWERRAGSHSESTRVGQRHDTFVLHSCPSAQRWLRSSKVYSLGLRVWSGDLNPVQPWLHLHQPAGTTSICFYIHFYINFILLEISLKPTSSVDMCNMKSSRWIGSVDGDNTLATLHGSNCPLSTWLGRNVKANAVKSIATECWFFAFFFFPLCRPQRRLTRRLDKSLFIILRTAAWCIQSINQRLGPSKMWIKFLNGERHELSILRSLAVDVSKAMKNSATQFIIFWKIYHQSDTTYCGYIFCLENLVSDVVRRSSEAAGREFEGSSWNPRSYMFGVI